MIAGLVVLRGANIAIQIIRTTVKEKKDCC